jgi:hypothetical protein
MMNDVFYDYLDDFMVFYINNILIFSKNMVDHECHVCLVLEKFLEVRIYAKLEKCGFHQFEMEFLGYIISRDGICMDPHKVQNIVDGLPQLLFGIFNVFLGSPISIGDSLYIISR